MEAIILVAGSGQNRLTSGIKDSCPLRGGQLSPQLCSDTSLPTSCLRHSTKVLISPSLGLVLKSQDTFDGALFYKQLYMAILPPGRYLSLVRNSPDAWTKLTCQVQCAPAVQSRVGGDLALGWHHPPPPHNACDPHLPSQMTPSCHRHLCLHLHHRQHHLTPLRQIVLHQLQSFVLPSSDWPFSVDEKHCSFQGKWQTNTSHPHPALAACKQKLPVRKCSAA